MDWSSGQQCGRVYRAPRSFAVRLESERDFPPRVFRLRAGGEAAYREIVEYLDQQYADASPAKVGDFLGKADCWIIAHALAKGGTVVTRESKVDKTSQTPKVPNFARSSMCRSFKPLQC